MLIFNNFSIGAQVFELLFTLFICYSILIFLVILKKGLQLPTKTSEPNQKDPKGKRKEAADSKNPDKKTSKKGKVANHDNDGCRTPERQGNMDLENNNPPAPPAAQREELSVTEADRQRWQSAFRDLHNKFGGNK